MNIATFIVLLILLSMVGYAVRTIVYNKKQGKGSCGGECKNCAMYGQCHKDKDDSKK